MVLLNPKGRVVGALTIGLGGVSDSVQTGHCQTLAQSILAVEAPPNLNMRKTVVIPLDPVPVPEWRRHFLHRFPGWGEAQFSDCGLYLGYMVGPGKEDSSWSKPSAKLLTRGQLWGRVPGGLHSEHA